jgi:hypothetical protein
MHGDLRAPQRSFRELTSSKNQAEMWMTHKRHLEQPRLGFRLESRFRSSGAGSPILERRGRSPLIHSDNPLRVSDSAGPKEIREHLSRKYGLIDNLLSADIVLADA